MRFWYRVVGGVLLVALAVAGGLVWLHPKLPVSSGNATQTLRPSDPLTVDTISLGIPCVDGAAWSLDGRRFVPAQAGGRPFSTMAWSPDSTRLLLVPQGPVPIIHVLGPKSLGS